MAQWTIERRFIQEEDGKTLFITQYREGPRMRVDISNRTPAEIERLREKLKREAN